MIFPAISAFLAWIIGSLRVETDGDDEDVNNNDEIDGRNKISQ